MSQLSGMASEFFYRSVEWADRWIGLPESVSKTLLFRRHWAHFLSQSSISANEKPALWIHGASVGELEDLAGLFLDLRRLEKLKLTPESLILTGASASLEERFKNWSQRMQFRYAGPLPPDEASEIDSFLQLLRPNFLVISQNDLWPQLLARIQKQTFFQGILWLPASKKELPFFTPSLIASKLLGVGFRHQEDLKKWSHKFPRDRIDQRVIGNPRIDRILSRIEMTRSDPEGHILTDFEARPDPNKTSVILGSAWKEDAQVWRQALDLLSDEERASLQIVALPHEADNLHELASIRQLLPEARVLGLQGVLLESYQGFQLAYVGGAFSAGLHNVLEALLWKIPIFCGPKIGNQSEAEGLVARGTLKSFEKPAELALILRSAIKKDESLQKWKQATEQDALHFEESHGAIDRICTFIQDISGRSGEELTT